MITSANMKAVKISTGGHLGSKRKDENYVTGCRTSIELSLRRTLVRSVILLGKNLPDNVAITVMT